MSDDKEWPFDPITPSTDIPDPDGRLFGSPPNPELPPTPSPVVIPDDYKGPTLVPDTGPANGR